jgi:hypothetical protein
MYSYVCNLMRNSGVGWSGVEWSGVEWSGVEWSGVGRCSAPDHLQSAACYNVLMFCFVEFKPTPVLP